MRRPHHLLAGALIAVAILAAYGGTLSDPFVSDDISGIVQNTTIRSLWPLGHVLSPPHDDGQTVGGRPLVNLSLALNHAIGGLDPRGYHAFNILIHILASLLVYGICRRTADKLGASALPYPGLFALAMALLWALHPLQTESVTYTVQRAESMMGMFYLLTLYCFIRSATERPRVWGVLCVVSCFLGMATKEVMVSAPIIVLLYDRTFLAGSVAGALRQRRPLHLGLAASWLLLGALVVSTGNRGGSMGLGLGVPWGAYLLSQVSAVGHYLRLALWPAPLVFDYGTQWEGGPVALAASALVLVTAAAITVAGLRRRSWVGFLGVWFFAILAPTSLVPANRFTLAEHRMYLALIPVLAAALAALVRASGRNGLVFSAAFLLPAIALASATHARNGDYATELGLWTDTVAKLPTNPYARDQLGSALDGSGRAGEAIAEFRKAVELKPEFPQAFFNLGNAQKHAGRPSEAIASYEEALRLRPVFIEARDNLANLLTDEGRLDQAFAQFGEILRQKPDFPEARNNYGNALSKAARLDEAIAQYRQAIEGDPGFALAHYNLGNALFRSDRPAEAIEQYRRCLQIQPDYAPAHHNLGAALQAVGRELEGQAELEEAHRLRAR